MSKKSVLIGGLVLFSLSFHAYAEKRDRTVAEMTQSIRAKAKRLDADGNGVLSDQETARGRGKLGLLANVISATVDVNGDNVITVKEYVSTQVDAIEKADRDRNGVVSIDEQKAQQRNLIRQLMPH